MTAQPAFDKPVSIEEYLSMAFEHGCEYVDGILEERTGSEFDPSFVKCLLLGLFFNNRKEWGVYPLPTFRIQTQKTRYRVPDLTILREGWPHEPILRQPPFMVIEIQSPDQPMSRTAKKSAEYLAFGIEHVWVIDPYARVGYRGTAQGLELVRTGELSIPGSPIRIVLEDLFAELDRV